MKEPRRWAREEPAADPGRSRETFRKPRLDEPLALYPEFFNAFAPIFGRIIGRLPRPMEDSVDPEAMPDPVREADDLTAFIESPGPRWSGHEANS